MACSTWRFAALVLLLCLARAAIAQPIVLDTKTATDGDTTPQVPATAADTAATLPVPDAVQQDPSDAATVIDISSADSFTPGTDEPDPPPPPPEQLPAAPVVTRSRRNSRRFNAGLAAVTPSAVTRVTCKLDASGNVADIVVARQDGSVVAGCGGSDTSAVLTGGRNVVLDFTDRRVVQVMQGKLSSTAGAPISWFAFRTSSPDLRTCGLNVQPTSANAVLTTFTAAAGKGLDSVTLSCASGRLQALSAASFAVSLPATVSLAPNASLPTCCTPVFTQPGPNISSTDNICCKTWVAFNPSMLKQNSTALCPYAASPKQWANTITTAQLPAARPPNWNYRNLSSAISTSVTLTVRTNQFIKQGDYITAKVRHAPIPGVTAAMVAWWFNGNVDGDMVLGGNVYQRYLVWHPRDHISQGTLIRGPTPGKAEGAWWSIVEFIRSNNTTGYTKSSSNWANNYIAYASVKVYQLNANTLDMRVVVDGAVPFRLLHTWSDTTAGGGPALAMNSTLYLGTQPPSTDSLLSTSMNPVAFKLFGGDCANASANAWVQHCVEEMGNFQYFLPALYRSQTGL